MIVDKYDWKRENPKPRYIDDLTDDECKTITVMALGSSSENVTVNSIDRICNPNNIPHVKIHCIQYEPIIEEDIETFIGIFENLDVYHDKDFMMVYSQKEIFNYFKIIGLDV